mgnify:CR=1 FL=1
MNIFNYDVDIMAIEDAIEFLKEKGIIFKDRYHILDQLDKKEPLAYYLEKIAGDRK